MRSKKMRPEPEVREEAVQVPKAAETVEQPPPAKSELGYIEFAPGQFLFTQERDRLSHICQDELEKKGKAPIRQMLASGRHSPSQVNGAMATPDDSGKVWPHLILITAS